MLPLMFIGPIRCEECGDRYKTFGLGSKRVVFRQHFGLCGALGGDCDSERERGWRFGFAAYSALKQFPAVLWEQINSAEINNPY